MSRVLTNEQNYYDIADTIRQMKNVNTTYKSREMASALKDIYSNEVEGTLPLSFEANGNNLLDYRIDGASGGVGDRTGNLFDGSWENKFVDTYGNTGYSTNRVLSSYVKVIPNQTYSVKSNMRIRAVHSYNDTTHTQALIDSVAGLDGATFTIPADSNSIRISLKKTNDGDFTPDDIDWCMLNIGSEALPNEPYGYKVPVVVSGKNLFNKNNILRDAVQDSGTYKAGNGTIVLIIDVSNIDTVSFKTGVRTQRCRSAFSVEYPAVGVSYTINNVNTFQNNDNNTGKITRAVPIGAKYLGVQIYRNSENYTEEEINNAINSFIACNGNNIGNYEPYHEPITTNIYLDNPIRTINDEVEYIDYSEQKQHRVRKNLLDFNWLWDYSQHSATNFFVYVEILLEPNTTYIVSSNYSYSVSGNTTAWIVANSETEIKTNLGGIFGSREVTTAQDGILKIARRVVGNQENMIPKRSELESGEKYIQVEKGSVATEYEPYIEDTEVDVTLPAIPTLDGTNTLSIDTTVQPSNVYIQAPKDSIEATMIANALEEI